MATRVKKMSNPKASSERKRGRMMGERDLAKAWIGAVTKLLVKEPSLATLSRSLIGGKSFGACGMLSTT